MLRRLWFHRDMEILQGKITAYLFSANNTWLSQDRAAIQYEWNQIQKEVNEMIAEMDREVHLRQTSQQSCRTCARSQSHPLS
jgi:hypothetical protein